MSHAHEFGLWVVTPLSQRIVAAGRFFTIRLRPAVIK